MGVVFAFLDARHRHPKNEPVAVKVYMVDPEKVGQAVIRLRQGGDDYENLKKISEMA
jgi:hypothetical protein